MVTFAQYKVMGGVTIRVDKKVLCLTFGTMLKPTPQVGGVGNYWGINYF